MTRSLRRAVEFFTADRDLASIDANAVPEWITWLRTRASTAPSNSDLLHDIYALSNLYLYAPINFPGVLPLHYNPVREIPKRQKSARHAAAEAAFLEPDTAVLLLETARIYKPLSIRRTQEPDHVFELVATFLYTGARLREVLGLLACDISLREGVVNIRSHPHRRLKTETTARSFRSGLNTARS